MRSYQQTSALPRQKLTDRFNFRWACLLLCDHVIQTKNHHRIGVTKDLIVQWQALTRLVNPLVNYDGVSRSLTDERGQPTRRTSVIVEKRLSSSVTSRLASQG